MRKFKRNRTVIYTTAGVTILLILIAIVRIGTSTYENRTRVNNATSTAELTESAAVTSETPQHIEVIYTAQGFMPATTTIERGQTIVFKNKSNNAFWPASDDHPTHQIYPEFDARRPIIPGQDFMFTFTKTGEWTFHNHLHSTQTGLIIVK